MAAPIDPALAEERWRRFGEAAARRSWDRECGRMERRLDLLLARGAWPGQAALILRSGLWDFGLKCGLGRDGGKALGLMTYARAGARPSAHPKALFDQDWYLEQNPELAGGRLPPLAHYLATGDRAGRDPHPLFDLRDYRSRHAVKIAASGLTALQHYVYTGAREGFDPHPLFDLRHYVGQAKEVVQSGEDPLAHYLREGWRLGYDPHPRFANDWYRARYPQVDAQGISPLLHYVTGGAAEGCAPHPDEA
jgi:hypothetical protein